MSNQIQDSLLELARKFKRFERNLVYDICAETPDSHTAINDHDLDLPVPFHMPFRLTFSGRVQTIVLLVPS